MWSNTCCGHPYPDEPPFVAAARRTGEELGVAPALMREAGTVRYNHPDPASGLVEQEYNHLFVGTVRARPEPDPEEIAETAFVTPRRARRAAQAGHLLRVVHDSAGRRAARDPRGHRGRGGLVTDGGSGRAAQTTLPPLAVRSTS
ncbi:hypothetical protein GCM10020000_14570 [Streptomyces olivoverticillatus]